MQKTITVCDVDGENTETKIYRLGGQYGMQKKMDLCAQHAKPLEDLMALGTKTTPKRATGGTVTELREARGGGKSSK